MHSGVKPDIMTFAKGIGGGFPVGGFVVTERLAHVLNLVIMVVLLAAML